VDRLDPEARRVLQQASVIGRTFYRTILAELTDADDTLDGALEALSRADLIRESARTPELEFAFRHPLILETAPQHDPRRRRQEFHRRVGEAIERLFAARLDERAGRIGHHYFQANDERAITWLVRAAEQAQRVYEPNAVIEVLTQAEDRGAARTGDAGGSLSAARSCPRDDRRLRGRPQTSSMHWMLPARQATPVQSGRR
jgi:predicted ATPase